MPRHPVRVKYSIVAPTAVTGATAAGTLNFIAKKADNTTNAKKLISVKNKSKIPSLSVSNTYLYYKSIPKNCLTTIPTTKDSIATPRLISAISVKRFLKGKPCATDI